MPRLPVPGSDNGNWGEILNEYLEVSLNADGSLNASAADVGALPGLRVGLILPDPTQLGGSYSSNVWTIGALSSLPTTGDTRLLAVLGTEAENVLSTVSNGLFEHKGGGVLERVRSWAYSDSGSFIASEVAFDPNDGSTVCWLFNFNGTDLGYKLISIFNTSALESQIDAVETQADDLEARLNRYYPPGPVVPHLHVSKYVTFDPDFPLDGSATHVGGQLIETGQNITILSNDAGNGGVWTLSTSGSATRAQGLGSMASSDIGNYDHITFTGTRWAYFCLFRLYGDPTEKGLAPVLPDNSGIFGGEGVNRVYRPDLIATDLSGNTLTVLNANGSTSAVSISADLAGVTICILVLDTLEMVTVANGSRVMTENFAQAQADGVWIAVGAASVGQNAIVATNGQDNYSILTVSPTLKAQLDDFESRITALETP